MKKSQPAGTAGTNGRAYSHREVVGIIRSVLETIDRNNEPTARLHNELSTIAAYIENMRAELAQLRSIEISHDHIPAASDELDAVVEETAKATGAIMDACEKIERVAGDLPAPASSELSGAVTSVYEACSFQDITGQRITKVVKTLKRIESKVLDIIEALGHPASGGCSVPAPKEEKSLLNGPQLKGAAASQEEIDRLLASFG